MSPHSSHMSIPSTRKSCVCYIPACSCLPTSPANRLVAILVLASSARSATITWGARSAAAVWASCMKLDRSHSTNASQ